ncbi:Secreted protein with PEP-CTERM sorting signal [Nocardia ninae]
MAKHRRKKREAPVDYGLTLAEAAVIAGALVLVRWLRAK